MKTRMFDEQASTLAKIIKFNGGSSDTAIIEVNGKRFVVFFPYFSSYGWLDLEKNGSLNEIEEKNYLMTFRLLPFSLEPSKTRTKILKHNPKHGFEYQIQGSVTSKNSNSAIVDCAEKSYSLAEH